MATEKYLNYTVLNYYNSRLAATYAKKTEIPTKTSDLTNDSSFVTSSDLASEITIKTVKVNSTALTPDSSKAVNVTVPTTVAQLSDASTYANKIETIRKNGTDLPINEKVVNITVPTSFSDLTGASAYENKIEVVRRNGAALPISSKAVDVSVPTTVAELSDSGNYALASSVPTKTSDLTNDSNFVTSSAIKINTIKKNGVALTPDGNKAVNIVVPTSVSDLNDASSYENKIEVIKVNGSAKTITNKTVDINVPTQVSELSDASDYALAADVPTKTSDLTNDSNFQNATQVSSAISAAIVGVYIYKGSVASYNLLPTTGNVKGDVWDVQDTGMDYAWTGTAWNALGTTVDLSNYWAKSQLVAITNAEIDALFT